LKTAIDIFTNKHSKKFLYQLVSGQLDVDRMDYLNRDSFFTGVAEGVIGYDRILKMLTVKDGNLVVEEKAIYSIEKFLVSRRLMYWQVYLHKTVLSAEMMLVKIIRRAKELIAAGETVTAATDELSFFLQNANSSSFIEQHLETFCRLDDHDIMATIKNWSHHPDKILATLCRSLVERNLLKVKLQAEPFDVAFIKEKTKEACDKLGISEKESGYFVFTGEASNTTYNPGDERINILFKDGTVKDVKMVREEVSIEDTFAKSIIINSPKGEKFGFISLPSFNADFEDAKGRNASDDVKAEILKLKARNVKGIILDLRNNGGGSLTEVVDIMGLFMNNGPVVQVKDGNGKIQVLKNKQNEPIWTGPLAIMQNELSASASEILAGAMKDYGRAVVIGSPHSFGKGTVQTFVELNRFLSSSDDFGALKLTIQKFYRVNGKSTQLKGIESDIPMNGLFTYAEIGEKYDTYALPWDQINTTNFQAVNSVQIPELLKNSQKRLADNKNYQLWQESAKWRESLDKEEKISLNQTQFNEVVKKRKAQIERFKVLTKFNNGLTFSLSPEEAARVKKDEVFAKKNETWTKNLKRDIYLQEAVNIISEMK
jgi:C-terminal peptidase prc